MPYVPWNDTLCSILTSIIFVYDCYEGVGDAIYDIRSLLDELDLRYTIRELNPYYCHITKNYSDLGLVKDGNGYKYVQQGDYCGKQEDDYCDKNCEFKCNQDDYPPTQAKSLGTKLLPYIYPDIKNIEDCTFTDYKEELSQLSETKQQEILTSVKTQRTYVLESKEYDDEKLEIINLIIEYNLGNIIYL